MTPPKIASAGQNQMQAGNPAGTGAANDGGLSHGGGGFSPAPQYNARRRQREHHGVAQKIELMHGDNIQPAQFRMRREESRRRPAAGFLKAFSAWSNNPIRGRTAHSVQPFSGLSALDIELKLAASLKWGQLKKPYGSGT